MDDKSTNEYSTRTVITGHVFTWDGFKEFPEARSVAVFIHYDSELMRSPKMVEKGFDSAADFLVSTAGAMGIPVVQECKLTGALYLQLTVTRFTVNFRFHDHW